MAQLSDLRCLAGWRSEPEKTVNGFQSSRLFQERLFYEQFLPTKIHTDEAGSEAISALTAKGRVGVSALSA
jgi:hypothetical protein